MKHAFQIILTIIIVWAAVEVLAILFGLWVFSASVNHLDSIDQSKGKQYQVTLTSSQKQANDAEHHSNTNVSQHSEASLEGSSEPSTYAYSGGQQQDQNGNWKFVDKFNNPMPNDWQPSDGTDYQTHLNPNYKGE